VIESLTTAKKWEGFLRSEDRETERLIGCSLKEVGADHEGGSGLCGSSGHFEAWGRKRRSYFESHGVFHAGSVERGVGTSRKGGSVGEESGRVLSVRAVYPMMIVGATKGQKEARPFCWVGDKTDSSKNEHGRWWGHRFKSSRRPQIVRGLFGTLKYKQ